ncbi:MAG: hypothetical protein QOF04_3290 [Solirubrobacteraceae bacterium]|jgi:hypothetical protein|nr:hypothetical protein [Solirubrobacteraceae bacterium]
MTRIRLIPTRTADGRHLVLHAVPVRARERLRLLVERLLRRPG